MDRFREVQQHGQVHTLIKWNITLGHTSPLTLYLHLTAVYRMTTGIFKKKKKLAKSKIMAQIKGKNSVLS